MKKIIFRKFLYDVIAFFLIVSISLTLITWVIQSVNYLDLISKDGHGFKVYFSFIALNFPKTFSKVIIFSYFISLFYIIQKYQENNEILIFWINGISKINLINFIIKISLVFTILQIFLVFFIVPSLQNYSRDFIRSSGVDLFSSLINQKKFIDTVQDFTIYIDEIDEQKNMKNIYIKDSTDKVNTQIISAASGKIIENGSSKTLLLYYGEIIDITNNIIDESKIIKFNSTNINLSNFKSKTTTFPKLQELDSKILIECVNNFFFGNKKNYSLPSIFHCSQESSIKSARELFKRSIKQLYIIVLGTIASILLLTNKTYFENTKYKILIFFTGIILITFSELNSELIDASIIKNIFYILIPSIFFVIFYLLTFNLNKKHI